MKNASRLALAAVICAGSFLASLAFAAPDSAPATASAPAAPLKAVAPPVAPRDAMVNMIVAIQNNDKKLFTDTMYMGEGDESAMRDALFDSMRASMALGQDIEKTYGKQEGSAVPTAEEMAKLEITEEGDHANAVGGAPLIKKDGKWMVDMSQQIPPGPNKDIAIKAMHASAAAFDKVRQDVGKPDFTAEKIKQELRTELQSAMMKIQMEAAPQMQAAQSQSASQPAAAPVAEPK